MHKILTAFLIMASVGCSEAAMAATVAVGGSLAKLDTAAGSDATLDVTIMFTGTTTAQSVKITLGDGIVVGSSPTVTTTYGISDSACATAVGSTNGTPIAATIAAQVITVASQGAVFDDTAAKCIKVSISSVSKYAATGSDVCKDGLASMVGYTDTGASAGAMTAVTSTKGSTGICKQCTMTDGVSAKLTADCYCGGLTTNEATPTSTTNIVCAKDKQCKLTTGTAGTPDATDVYTCGTYAAASSGTAAPAVVMTAIISMMALRRVF